MCLHRLRETCPNKQTYVYIYTYIYIYIALYIYIDIYLYIHIYIYVYTCSHTDFLDIYHHTIYNPKHVCINIYIQRERDVYMYIEREIQTYID